MSQPSLTSPGAANWALLNLLGIVWGTSFLSIRISLETLPPIWVATGRLCVAALVMLALLPILGHRTDSLPRGRGLKFALIAGIIGLATPFLLLAWGQQFVPSAVAGVAMGSVPLLLLPLVYVFSPEEGIGPRRIAGLALGFAGLALLLGPGALAAGGATPSLWAAGATACVLAAFCYAIASVITRRAPSVSPVTFTTVELCAAAVLLLPLAFIVEGWPEGVSARSLIAIVYLGVLPTAIASTIRVQIIRSAGSLFMSLGAYLVPTWSVIFGIVLMGEDLPPQLFWALALIVGGIALSQSRAILEALRRR